MFFFRKYDLLSLCYISEPFLFSDDEKFLSQKLTGMRLGLAYLRLQRLSYSLIVKKLALNSDEPQVLWFKEFVPQYQWTFYLNMSS